jgi:hypothetical protein
MSAQTTIEIVEQEENVAFVDTYGNQYCAQCYYAEIPSLPCSRATPDNECDHCGVDMKLSIEIVTGSLLVEYPPCKIF